MSCQPSLERAGELIQLVNHLLRGSAVPLCGLEARRVVCQCRRRSLFFFLSAAASSSDALCHYAAVG